MRNWSDVGGIAARILACGGAVIDAAPVAGTQSASRARTSEPVKPRSAIRLRSGTQRSDGRYRCVHDISVGFGLGAAVCVCGAPENIVAIH